MNKTNKRILVAMSGGVDSTVCAHLIKQAGYDTEGITMRLWSDNEAVTNCAAPAPDKNCTDARTAADAIGIPHRCIALGDSFRRDVVDRFISDYIHGLTPNPCVECNKHIKFGALMDHARAQGFELLATGHYARIERNENGEYLLKKAVDTAKDQSYFLWSIKKEYLPHILFPLGELTKSEIRAIAEKEGLECAHRADSQDICFIQNGDYASFIRDNTTAEFPEGSFVSPDGQVLGRHSGLINYTIGQRKGLGIALGRPMFVGAKSIADNTVTLCEDSELYVKTLTAHHVNVLAEGILGNPSRLSVKIRYRHTPAPATARLDGDRLYVEFDEPQRAITPGQSVVVYDGDTVVCGGIID